MEPIVLPNGKGILEGFPNELSHHRADDALLPHGMDSVALHRVDGEIHLKGVKRVGQTLVCMTPGCIWKEEIPRQVNTYGRLREWFASQIIKIEARGDLRPWART